MELRPYQAAAKQAIQQEWARGHSRTLLVLPTGTGKTIVFAKVAEDCVRNGERVLILAHRGELLDQAADKLAQSTGLGCAVEKAESSCLDSWFRVVVGSVQTLMREDRLAQFDKDHFGAIIVDEAHHAISESYQRVLSHFDRAKVLGVTATPDRGDMRNLGQYFQSLAYEYTLPKAIREGYLSPIRAQTIPLKLDLSGVGVSAGDFKAADLGSALDPYLYQIAEEMAKRVMDRKTVVFLPLIKTSQKFRDILRERGFEAAEVNGESDDRAQILADFDAGRYNVLCNSMLLCLDTETEILTDRGFVKHDEMTMQHKVANWCMDGSVYFEEPHEIVKRPLGVAEHMVSIQSKTFDLRVTNTHRMVVSCGQKRKAWTKVSAAELRNGHLLPAFGVAEPFDMTVRQPEWPDITQKQIVHTAYNLRKSGRYSHVESYEEARRRKEQQRLLTYTQPQELTRDDCRLIGFWIADGSRCELQSGGIEYTLCQSPNYPVIVQWIDDLLGRLGLNFVRRSKARAIVWSLARGTGSGPQEKIGLFRLEPYLCKEGTNLFWGLNEEQFDALVEGYWYGDGWHGQAETGMPSSIVMRDTKKPWIDLLCTIGSVRGWRCHMMPRPSTNPNHSDQWELRMVKGRHLNISCKTPITAEPYAPEDVWCVRTSSKNIITRRNGCVTVMGNTEGWDCPSVDCIVVLRPTKIRSLYSQMVGRGTRLYPGKDHLLLLDFLWHTERHELCHPAHLICESDEVAKKMTENIKAAESPVDLEEAERQAEQDVVTAREEALAKKLAEMRRRKAKLVDPLQFEMSIQAEDLTGYKPVFGWQVAPASEKQLQQLEKLGILPDEVESAGKASLLLDRLHERIDAGLTTPKQIRCLERMGFRHVGTWQFEAASNLISRIAMNGWRVPHDIDPSTYMADRGA